MSRDVAKAALKQFKQASTASILSQYLGHYEMAQLEAVDDYIADTGLPATTLASERFAVLSDYANMMVVMQSILCSVEIQQKALERDKMVVVGDVLHDLIEDGDIKSAPERSSVANKDARVVDMCQRLDEVGVVRNYVLNKYNLLVYIMKTMQNK